MPEERDLAGRAFDEACWRAARVRFIHVTVSLDERHMESMCKRCRGLEWAGSVFHNWNDPTVSNADITRAMQLLQEAEGMWPTVPMGAYAGGEGLADEL